MRKRHRLKLGSTCEYTFNEEQRRYEATKVLKTLPPNPIDKQNEEMDKAFQELVSAMEFEERTKITVPTVYHPPRLEIVTYEENTYLTKLKDLIETLKTETTGIAHVLRKIKVGRLVRNRAFYDSLPKEAKKEMKLYAEDRELLKGRKLRKSDARPTVLLMPPVNRIDPFAEEEETTKESES
jgi:hypothetical protein